MEQRPELVIALVGPVGTRLNDLADALKAQLTGFGYSSVDIRLSSLLRNFACWCEPAEEGEAARIRHLQETGNQFRRCLNDGSALARAAISAIRDARFQRTGDSDTPQPATAYVLRQLKHPAEVDLLRRVYGSVFLLVAAHASAEARITSMAQRLAAEDLHRKRDFEYQNSARAIVTIDDKEADDYGQNTRDAYPLADCFIDMNPPRGEFAVGRFIDLAFGHPFSTPTPDEYAMYLASSVALRSSDDSRQVGAVIVDLTRDRRDRVTNADLVAVGMNEVPRGGGGFYWDQDSPDHRDQALLIRGVDRAMGLIRFRGHLPKGGYDVPHVEGSPRPARPPAIH